ncbi:hypothetical protein [Dipodfec virus UOA04_Rod_841]|nr:hypothetical protein [Dipodfec virus UOA04_Rod_841]
MYIKKSLISKSSGVSFRRTVNEDNTKVYHPLSYYVLGGIDVTGEGLDMSFPVSYDSPEDLESAQPDARCDPRVSFFDIAEEVGVRAAKSAEESKQ